MFSIDVFLSLCLSLLSLPLSLQGVVVKNMSFKVGQTLTITGVPNSEAAHFVINVGNSEDDLALHMNPRFDAHGDTRAVVCNSYHGGKWCEEHREGGFPFNQGEEFKVRNYTVCVCVCGV
uniref:Galectin n=1 Tax=Hucho hucho TaxID=62062 RepID=A0A4W5Q8S8_9TELE